MVESIEFTNHFFCKIQTYFIYITNVFWYRNRLEKELGTNFFWWKLIKHFFNIYSVDIARSIHKNTRWLRHPIPSCFWYVAGLHKSLNVCSAEQETVVMTLKMTATFPKFQRAIWPKKIEWDNKIFGYIYTYIIQCFFAYFIIVAHTANLAYSGRILFANICL